MKRIIKPIVIWKVVCIVILIISCNKIMSLCPIWNGEIPNHRNQYEKMAESLLHRRLYLDEYVEEDLLDMENPYDPDARDAIGVDVRWDHAFYNGRYYMYFGIVPVVMLFLPFRLITGRALITYHATQFYTAFIIIGFFALFGLLRKKFFPKMNEFAESLLSTAISLASIWYFVEAPAMYCTAISAAVCMMIWALFFFIIAVFSDHDINLKLLFAFVGSIFGALSFGCRPPIALANIIFIPLFIIFLKTNKNVKNITFKIFLIIIPYIVIGGLLMLYNYARFDNPFEFGQSYQMTFYDQHNNNFFSNFSIKSILNGLYTLFFVFNGYSGDFPYVKFGGVFAEFPLFFIGFCLLFFYRPVYVVLQKKQLLLFVWFMILALVLITIIEVTMSPIILERYHSDVYFLAGILAFILIGCFLQSVSDKNLKILNYVVITLSVMTFIKAILLFFIPNDLNYTQYYTEFMNILITRFPHLNLN